MKLQNMSCDWKKVDNIYYNITRALKLISYESEHFPDIGNYSFGFVLTINLNFDGSLMPTLFDSPSLHFVCNVL